MNGRTVVPPLITVTQLSRAKQAELEQIAAEDVTIITRSNKKFKVLVDPELFEDLVRRAGSLYPAKDN